MVAQDIGWLLDSFGYVILSHVNEPGKTDQTGDIRDVTLTNTSKPPEIDKKVSFPPFPASFLVCCYSQTAVVVLGLAAKDCLQRLNQPNKLHACLSLLHN